MRTLALVMFSALLATPAEARERVGASANAVPTWVRSVPAPDARFLYFVGFTSDFGTLDEARQQATKRAMSEIVDYFGQEGQSRFVSTETETEKGHRYDVTLQIQFEGKKVTLRGIQLSDWYYEEYRDDGRRSYDFHALVRYPREEYSKVLAELATEKKEELNRQEERTRMALARYQLGQERARASRHLEAIVFFDEASAILGNAQTLLNEEITRARAKSSAIHDAKYRTISAHATCTRDAIVYECRDVETTHLELASSVGFAALEVTTATTATFRVELKIDVTSSGEIKAVHYARANGSFRVVQQATGQVMGSGEIAPQKAGQLTADRAAELAANGAKKQLSIEVRKALRRL